MGFRQFIIKGASFGIKIFVLSPLVNTGMDIPGKGDFKADDPAAENLIISDDIIIHLVKDLLDHGQHVVTDNWYTSLTLSSYLLTQQ